MQALPLHEEEWEYVRTLLPSDLEESARKTNALLRCRNVPDAAALMRLALAYAVVRFVAEGCGGVGERARCGADHGPRLILSFAGIRGLAGASAGTGAWGSGAASSGWMACPRCRCHRNRWPWKKAGSVASSRSD